MNELGTTVAWSALQVTALAIVASGLYLVVARRAPGVAAFVTVVSLGVILGLTGLAFCPLPHCCRWDLRAGSSPLPERKVASPVITRSEPEKPISAGPESDLAPASSSEAGGLAWSVDSLRRAWDRLRRAQASDPERRRAWPKVVAGVFLTGFGLGLLRFLVGLWAVHSCRRRCRPVHDAAMIALLETLRAEMGCGDPVELRECRNLATAATVGWRRPLVLVPSDWRTWTDVERRAVLAHELAHIRRGDYLAGLLARISVALHFYHPLVYWLANRLHLQQELAADALGAKWAGGHRSYLMALASLVLRQENRSPGWPARAFLPARGTLMRRIQMLRADRPTQSRLAAWTVRVMTAGLLGTVAVALAGLRLPMPSIQAQEPVGKADDKLPGGGASVDAPFSYVGKYHWQVNTEGERERFDLSWFPTDALGVLAVRPAAVLKRPGMEPLTKELDEEITREFKKMGMRNGLGVPLENLDQVLGRFQVLHEVDFGDSKKEALVAGLFMLRTVEDFDWKGLLQSNPPELATISYRGKVYYKPAGGARPAIANNRVLPYLGKDMCYFIPDARTLIVDTEANLRRLIKRGPAGLPEWVWAEGWAKVDRGLVAVALDCRRLLDEKARAEGPKTPERAIILNVQDAVWGIDGPDTLRMQGLARCATEQAAEDAFKKIDGLLAVTRLEFWLSPGRKQPPNDLEAQGLRFASDLLKHAKVQREEKQISFHTEAKVDSTELLKALIKEMK